MSTRDSAALPERDEATRVASRGDTLTDAARQQEDVAVRERLERMLDGSGFRVAHARGMRLDEHGIEIASTEAELHLEPVQLAQPGFYKAEIAFSSPELSTVRFELEYGARPGEHRRVLQLVHVGRGRFEGLFQLGEALTALVIHPGAVGSSFGFAEFRIARLGAIERGRRLARRALLMLRRGPSGFLAAVRRFEAAQASGDVVVVPLQERSRVPGNYERWLARFDDDPIGDERHYRERLARARTLPSFSVLVRTAGDPAVLARTTESLEGQLHAKWELLVDGATARATEGVADDADHVNVALDRAVGDWIVVVPAGAALRPHAL